MKFHRRVAEVACLTTLIGLLPIVCATSASAAPSWCQPAATARYWSMQFSDLDFPWNSLTRQQKAYYRVFEKKADFWQARTISAIRAAGEYKLASDYGWMTSSQENNPNWISEMRPIEWNIHVQFMAKCGFDAFA